MDRCKEITNKKSMKITCESFNERFLISHYK